MIEISHAYKVYPGPVNALRDINMFVDKGEFVFLTGPSGAGKTTLFRLMSAFEKPTTGVVRIMGADMNSLNVDQVPYFRRNIGVVYQDFKLLKQKSVLENVYLPLVVRGEKERSMKARAEEVLDQVGLLHKKKDFPEQLSGGEQQRVSIARAIIHRPGLLIADEPTGNLDPDLAQEIMRLFEKINAQGTTIFIATHDHELVHQRSRRLIQIKDGRVLGEKAC